MVEAAGIEPASGVPVGQLGAGLEIGGEAGDASLRHATDTNSERRDFSCSFSARRPSTVERRKSKPRSSSFSRITAARSGRSRLHVALCSRRRRYRTQS